AMIARVTAELQRLAADMSLQIKNIEQGSVRLYLELSEEGAKRLVMSWRRGALSTLCGFEVRSVEAEIGDASLAEASQAFAGTRTASALDPEEELVCSEQALARLRDSRTPPSSNKLSWVPWLIPRPVLPASSPTELYVLAGTASTRARLHMRGLSFVLGGIVAAGVLTTAISIGLLSLDSSEPCDSPKLPTTNEPPFPCVASPVATADAGIPDRPGVASAEKARLATADKA